MRELVEPYRDQGITQVAAMEARGFIFGSLAASLLGAGFVPLRKPGKLPHQTQGIEYSLEYGTARLEMHIDALAPTDRVLIVDDVLATGGTARAARDLVQASGASLAACAFLIELGFLNGRRLIEPNPVSSVIVYS